MQTKKYPSHPSRFEYMLYACFGIILFYFLTLAIADIIRPVDFPAISPVQATK